MPPLFFGKKNFSTRNPFPPAFFGKKKREKRFPPRIQKFTPKLDPSVPFTSKTFLAQNKKIPKKKAVLQ